MQYQKTLCKAEKLLFIKNCLLFLFMDCQKRKEGEKKKTNPTLVTQIICKVIYAYPKSKVRSVLKPLIN